MDITQATSTEAFIILVATSLVIEVVLALFRVVSKKH